MDFTKTQLIEFVGDIITSAMKKDNLIYTNKKYEEGHPKHKKMFIGKSALEDSLEEEISNTFND